MHDTTLLDSLVARASKLHTLPGVAVQVLDLTGRPEVDIRQLKQCIENDPALTSKILRVVNSSLFGLSKEVSNLNQALALLGIKPLKLLVLGFSLPPGLFAGLEAEVYQNYWRMTLTRAVAAREICRAAGPIAGDEPFIAALLMDIGIPVLVEGIGLSYVRFWKKVQACGGALHEAERRALGFDHVELSQRLLEAWKLPSQLVHAVGLPLQTSDTQPLPAESRRLAQVLRLAQEIAVFAVDNQAAALQTAYEVAWRELSIGQAALDMLISHLQHKVQQLADVLSLQLPGGLDYAELLTQAHASLALAAAESAGDMLKAKAKGASGRSADLDDSEDFRQLVQELKDVAAVAGSAARSGASQVPQVQAQKAKPVAVRPTKSESSTSTADRGSTGYRPPAPGPVTAPQRGGSAAKRNARMNAGPMNAGPMSGTGKAMGAPSSASARDIELAPASDGKESVSGPMRAASAARNSAPDEDDRALVTLLASAVSACRVRRAPLSLVLLHLDGFGDLVFQAGVARATKLVKRIAAACQLNDSPGAACLQIRDERFALMLPDCGRSAAIRVCDELLGVLRGILADQVGADSSVLRLCLGVASITLPTASFPPPELIRGAARCLSAALSANGDCVKSIECY